MDVSFADQEGHGAELSFSCEASRNPLESVALGHVVKLAVSFLALLSAACWLSQLSSTNDGHLVQHTVPAEVRLEAGCSCAQLPRALPGWLESCPFFG
ncbi:hypothetical protein P7K49_024599 [Saguinus oedipus]|uniref:Uncharacterized protein n=1 Tax=Saguinus oedipus TaxID=9490 RepID=A0ABQ9UQ10_SAGOE|nr:hypothetical protein P7K49_024599 [Saguinus oedipus]